MAITLTEQLKRKEEVLKVAYKLFVEHSIERVSMQKIADVSGVGIASVFRYYANKNDLVIAVSGYVWKEYLQQRVLDYKKWEQIRWKLGLLFE